MAIIEVEHLNKGYGSTVAVDDVSFSVNEGEIFGIIGPNGAGKTTTVEPVVGLRVPDAGTIRVLGLDPISDRRELREGSYRALAATANDFARESHLSSRTSSRQRPSGRAGNGGRAITATASASREESRRMRV